MKTVRQILSEASIKTHINYPKSATFYDLHDKISHHVQKFRSHAEAAERHQSDLDHPVYAGRSKEDLKKHNDYHKSERSHHINRAEEHGSAAIILNNDYKKLHDKGKNHPDIHGLVNHNYEI